VKRSFCKRLTFLYIKNATLRVMPFRLRLESSISRRFCKHFSGTILASYSSMRSRCRAVFFKMRNFPPQLLFCLFCLLSRGRGVAIGQCLQKSNEIVSVHHKVELLHHDAVLIHFRFREQGGIGSHAAAHAATHTSRGEGRSLP